MAKLKHEKYINRHKPPFRQSFGHAWDGICWTVLHERTLQIHLLATIVVTMAGLILRLTAGEWLALLIFFTLVPTIELINTAIEIMCNIMRDELHLDYAATKLPRDMLAGAVLYSTIGAVIAGLVIFLPKICTLLIHLTVI